ncbi:polyketide synthase, partial [Gemmatimonas sp.]|uniref:polyketide synthase n=1 Tax=Gemmatimonas sp. TaxID=1962908 RepID=UPI0037BEB46B
MSTDALLQRALDEIVRQREELAELRARDRTRVDMHAPEPIAIVGLGCRFPGQSDSPAAYWSLLDRGADGTCTVPSTRWTYDDSPTATVRGTHRVRRGGFLPTVDTFDATFFGISPREARVMDPQQRMLLETAWHALEHAGIDPTSLYGSATGVFVGVTCFDHAMRVAGHMDLLGPYAGTGSALNMIPGRLSFLLGLRGPSLAIDTACSSS